MRQWLRKLVQGLVLGALLALLFLYPQAAMQVIFFCADMGIYNGFLCALQAEERGIEK